MIKNKNNKRVCISFCDCSYSCFVSYDYINVFYYDSDLKSVSRNSVMQQVMLASETGLQEGQKWITDQLNADTFGLADIQNNFHVDASDNACLNRHGYTDPSKDVYFARRLANNLGTDDPKFEDVEYEVFVQRHADYVRSIYFSSQGSQYSGIDAVYNDRSFALVKKFKDFPTDQFTIEMWIKNERPTGTYNMHAFEWGREWDLVFKVKDDDWSPRLGEVVLAGSGQLVHQLRMNGFILLGYGMEEIQQIM